MTPLNLLKGWLWASTLASLAGWLLSACGQLNRLGYSVFFGLCLAVWWWRYSRQSATSRLAYRFWPRLRRRFRHWLPASFVVLSGLALLGALIYPPTNYAGLSYRTPRVLQWLSEEGWFWIHTNSYRLNNRAAGFEWLTAPLILFTRSDRLLFLVNYIPYLLLPGLFFSVCRSLGVPGRVAWWWMWILPTGYNFLLQAGSIANDTFPAIYALAAVFFGLKAWRTRAASDCWYATLAAALLTGAKASNLPLLLPWALLMIPLARLWLSRPAVGFAVLVLSLAVSFVVTAALNVRYCGDWSGLSLEREGMAMKNPLVGLWGNAFLVSLNNLVPPVFPLAGWWNGSAEAVLPGFLVRPMLGNFELGFLTLWELPGEDWVGLGFGVSILLLVAVGWGAFSCRVTRLVPTVPLPRWLRTLVLLAPWLGLVVYCLKSGMVTPARLISPYYPLLLPLLLLCGPQTLLVRRRWWRGLVVVNLALALAVLVVIPARPLWPAQTVFHALVSWRPGWRLAERGLKVYQVYAQRADPLPQVREALPSGFEIVGFLADGDDLDISFWRPFFSRRVKHLKLTDTPDAIRQRGIKVAVVGGGYLKYRGVNLQDWLERENAELLDEKIGLLKVSEGPQLWYVVRFR